MHGLSNEFAGPFFRSRPVVDTLGRSMRTFLATGLMLFANVALAQVDPAADHYKAGVTRFHAGQYADAIQEFQSRRRHSTEPGPQLRHRAMLREDGRGSPERQVGLSGLLAPRAPNADDREAASRPPSPRSIRSSPSRNSFSRDTVVLVPATCCAVGEVQASAHRTPNLTVGITTAALGAAGITAGAILNGLSHNASQSLKNDGLGGHYWSQSKAQGYYNTAQNCWTGALIGYIAGGVLLATGGES